MSDYKRTVELVEIAQNSAGRSSEQFAKYQDTLEMKIKRLQNTWEQFRVKIGRSDIFKNVVDGANEALSKSTQLDWTQILGIGIIGVTIGKRIVTDLISQIRETSSQFTNLGVQMGNSFQSGINKAMGAVSANVKRTAKDLQVVTAAKNTQKRIDNNAEKYYQLAYNKQIQKSTAAFGQNFNYSGKEVLVNEEIERSLREIIKLKERINALNLKGEQITEKETLELKQLNGELNKQKQLINNNISQLNTKAAGTKLSQKERNAASAYLINQATTAADTASLAAQRARSRYLYRANRVATPAVEELEELNNRAIQSERFKSRIASSVSTGLQSALALGLAEAFSGGDIKGIVRSSAEIFGITAIPQFVSAIGPVILKGLTKATGLSTGIIGIIISLLTGIGGLAIANLKKQQKEQQALIDKTKNLRDNIKDTLKELEITYSTSKKTIKQFDTAQEKYKDYIKLTSKTFLSDKDKEQLDTIKDYFAELYPDLEDDIRNGTADIAKILEDIRDQSNQAESIKEAKSVYNIAEVEKEKGDIEKNLKFFEKMALNNSFKSFKADNMVSMMSMSPTLDYTSFFKDNEKALKLYRSGENKAAWKELLKGQDYVEVNKTIKQLYEYILKSFDDVKENVDDDLYNTLAKSSGGTTEANEFIAQALKKTNVLDIADVKITDSQLNSFRQGIVPKIYQGAISNLGIDILELVQDGKFLSLSDIKDEKLSTWINSVFGEKGWEELIGKDKNDFKAVFSTLIKLGNGLDGAAKDILNNVEKYEELVNIIKNDSGLSAKEIEKKANELINKYNLGIDLNSGDNLYTKFKANVDYLDSLGLTAAQGIGPKLAQLIVNSLEALNLADNTTAASIINQAAKQADITTIANIPLDNLATLTATEAQTYIQLLEDGGKSAEDAQRIFWEYINKMRLATSRNLTNVEQIDVLREDNETFFESYISNLELIQKAQSDIQKSGFVSTSTRKAMVKANINKKYLDGIGLNEQAVKDFTITAMQPYQNALQQLESSKMAVDSLSKFDRDKFNYGLKYYQLDENFFDSYIGKTYMGYTPTQMEEIKAAAQSGAKSYDEYAAKLNNVVKELNNFPAEQAINGLTVIKEATEANKDAMDKLEKEILKLNKTIHNNDKSIHRLGRQIRDAEKDLLAATEGSENFRSSLDGLVNYTNQMSDLERSIERVGKALENTTEQSSSDSLITGLRDSLVNKAGLIQAERRVIENAMDNIIASLTTSFGNVFSVNENGLMNIDIGAFEKLRMSDTFKKEGGEALFNQYNQYYEQREQLIDNAEEVLKAFKDYQRQYLDAVVQAENDVASILEKQNEEEIDNLKDKYEAMEKADNEYLDALEKAINKQRKLRELENDYDDLATKRKKLSLMQRDTSGASQKDILSLSKDIKKSEENVLDKEVDNLIDELKELAETEKDTRDAELEYQEALKETVNWMLLAKDAMSKWTSVEDARAWRLSDPKFDELTEEQQEQELLKVEELYRSYINYLSSSKVEWKNNMGAIANKEAEYYKNTFENVSNIGSAILQDAQEKADKERQDADEKLEDLRQNLEDMEEQQAENLKELAEKETELANLRKSSEQQYLESINIMQEAAKSGFVDVAAFGLQQMASLESIQFNDLFNEDGSTNTNSAGYKWLSDKGQVNNGQISLPGLLAAGQGQTTGKVWGIIGEDGKLIKLNQSAIYNGSEQGYYTDEKKASADLNKLMTSSKGTFKGFLKQFAEGGLVNFTGPAWVDGTSSRPEAFLSADDTFRIGKAAELLANLPIFNRANDSISTNIGDTSIEIHLNIDKLASDYDVERMLDKVKENIVRIAKPIGSSVILSK